MGIAKPKKDNDPFPDIKKVGRKYGTKRVPFQYVEVHFLEKWADASKYLPNDFDLVLLKLSNGSVRAGWSVGYTWDGLKLKPEDVVIYWKRKDFPNEGVI